MGKKSEEQAVAEASTSLMSVTVEKERSEFQILLAGNPNYFGNLPGTPYRVVKKIATNTKYEELKCISFNPNLNQLEATIHIKLPNGYGGDLCHTGTAEFVRFFIDYGSGWEDAGIVTVNVHNIPNIKDCADKSDKPLVYVLTHPIEPKRESCGHPVLPKVRGILSWNAVPPAGPANANWLPVWGNVLDRHIQIKPLPQRTVIDLAHALGIDPKIKLPLELEVVKYTPIPLPDPPPFALKDLTQLYTAHGSGEKGASTAVEPHRFAFTDVHPVLAGGAVNQQILLTKMAEFQKLNLNWSSIVVALENTKGDMAYEELTCLGLDYNWEWLVGTFVVKKPTGYSGNLCSKGSTEYVTFWADWDNTCQWSYVGTAAVPVHDIAAVPPDGLHYAAVMPVDLSAHRQSCEKPKIARVRAVLSWNVPPSNVDPDAIPHWGNRLDTHVQIRPGSPLEIKPKISVIGGIGVPNIFTATTGMTKPFAPFAGWGPGVFADPWDHARSCPFGGVIHIDSAPIFGHKYKLWVQNVTAGGPEIQLTDPVWVVDNDGNNSNHIAGLGGMFDYLPVQQNLYSRLYSAWAPSGDDLWQIRLELFTGGGVLLGSTAWHRVQTDNTAPSIVTSPPTLDIHIESGGDCKDFMVGTVIKGRFVARDSHFGYYSLVTLPASMSPNAPVPSSGTSQTAPAPGDAWSVDTTGMSPCGYAILLEVWDRSIIDSHPGSHNYNRDDVGFCLRASGK
ncbi:MAG: hypothetical protein C3F08_08745 [Candidatus Methylomirabilota bacterium]|nr:MAG: hypothetical protein C3F08_08745 [candidate division NC10 bacterium]